MAASPSSQKYNVTEVPGVVISRLPLYLRALALLEQDGLEVTSSQELGDKLGISSAQIRKDLSHFGEFGKQGTGYKISFLKESLKDILNLNKDWSVALIGFGDLGNALTHYARFAERKFYISAIFDNAPNKVGQVVNDVTIKNSSEIEPIIKSQKIKIAIIAVPIKVAQDITDTLVKAGVKAILNYSPITLSTPSEVKVQNIDPVAHLQQMTYYL